MASSCSLDFLKAWWLIPNRQVPWARERKPDRGWISFSVFTLEVMQCHIHHILLIEAVRKMHLGSRGKNRSHLWKGECQCPSVRRAHGLEHTLVAILGKIISHKVLLVFLLLFLSHPIRAMPLWETSFTVSNALRMPIKGFFLLLSGFKGKIMSFSLPLTLAKLHIKYMKDCREHDWQLSVL